MAKFEDMLFELAMEAGKGTMWAEELRRKAIGFEPPRIADGVGGLSVPSLNAGEVELAQLTHLNASAFNLVEAQAITTATWTPISWAGDVYGRTQKPIIKVDPSDATKLSLSNWKWRSSLAMLFGAITWDVDATGVRYLRVAQYDAGDVAGSTIGSSRHDAASASNTQQSMAVPLALDSDAAYIQVQVQHSKGSDLNLVNAIFGAIRIF